jgi:hypothetical protein
MNVATNRILPDLSQQNAALEAQITELKAKLAEHNKPRSVWFKVSEKGCLQVGGGRIRKFGMVFYAEEWETVITNVERIKQELTNPALVRKFS